MAIRDDDEHAFYNQYNHSDTLTHCMVAYCANIAVGYMAFKEYKNGVAEIKRKYVLENSKIKGVAMRLLHKIEEWAFLSNYNKCILETGFY